MLEAAIAPWDRVREAPFWGWIGSMLIGLIQLLIGDVLTGILLILILASLVDWYYGSTAAKLAGNFKAGRSSWGFQSKLAGISQMILVRLLEHQGGRLGLIQTGGVISAALTFILVVRELESIDQHRRALGGQSIPVLSEALRMLRRLPEALFERKK